MKTSTQSQRSIRLVEQHQLEVSVVSIYSCVSTDMCASTMQTGLCIFTAVFGVSASETLLVLLLA